MNTTNSVNQISYEQMVFQFHETYGVPFKIRPDVNLDEERKKLRCDLLDEEVHELSVAMRQNDLVEVADGITDCMYILIGTAFEYGIGHLLPEMFAEVHRSNMSKLGADGQPIRRADGKVLKGPNFTPPNLVKILER